MVDLYPSRVSDKATITDRKDPVIHSDPRTASQGPLTKDQLNSFAENGFLFLENFFSEQEIQEMRHELDDIRTKNQQSDAAELIKEPGSNVIRSIFDVHQNHDFFKELARSPRLTDILRQILGSDVYVMQSRVNFKPGFTGKEFYWHSDFETWHVEDGMPRMKAVSCSIILTDNTPFNGPLMLVPGSHKYFISCIGETPESHYQQSLQKQEFGVPDHESLSKLVKEHGIEAPTGPAGSVLLFECNTMHGSNSNITPMARNNVFMVYNSVENKLVAPFSGMDPRPEFLANRHVELVTSHPKQEAFGAKV